MAKNVHKNRLFTETLSSVLISSNAVEQTVGSRLRELRRQQGLSMRALAEKSGLSTNTMSLIENGKTSPSVSTLQQISMALNCPINAFFEGNVNREPAIHTKRDQRRIKEFSNAKLEELGNGIGKEGLLPFIVSFDAHSESGHQALVREGNEMVFCLSGRINYHINGLDYALEPGDSLVFSAKTPHTWVNPTDESCNVLIVSNTLVK
jgi:transcriptional regulator with XRE-family HTH domain